jgi:hypothetical protein
MVMQWTWVDGLLIEIFLFRGDENERGEHGVGCELRARDKLEINQLTNKSLLIG